MLMLPGGSDTPPSDGTDRQDSPRVAQVVSAKVGWTSLRQVLQSPVRWDTSAPRTVVTLFVTNEDIPAKPIAGEQQVRVVAELPDAYSYLLTNFSAYTRDVDGESAALLDRCVIEQRSSIFGTNEAVFERYTAKSEATKFTSLSADAPVPMVIFGSPRIEQPIVVPRPTPELRGANNLFLFHFTQSKSEVAAVQVLSLYARVLAFDREQFLSGSLHTPQLIRE